jgi:glycogen debranching enzyme
MSVAASDPVDRYTVHTRLGPVSLATDETFVSIEASPFELPAAPLAPVDVLLHLAGVGDTRSLGQAGPVTASAVNPENAGNPELRRYEAIFGRDALYTAEFLTGIHPGLEDATVRYLAAYQASATEPAHQSAPGKVPNHIRHPDDPLAAELTRQTGRRWPWYGATDTTVQFLTALCRMVERHPDCLHEVVRHTAGHERAGEPVLRHGRPQTIGRAAVAAADWLRRELARPTWPSMLWVPMNDRDSFTVWTDSPNFFSFRDGHLPSPPVAPVQLQAQVYDALRGLAALAGRHPALRLDQAGLEEQADRLRRNVLDHFVVSDDRGTLLATAVSPGPQGELRPLDIRTVSMGMALDSELFADADVRDLREAVVRQLFEAGLSSPFGIAGRARDERRFEPFDYHSQIWGFAVHKVANGLAKHGYRHLAYELDARVMRQTRDGLLPENVGAVATDELTYCRHVLRVARRAADGRPTVTVKERPPAPYAAWTAGAVIEIDTRARNDEAIPASAASAFEDEVLANTGYRAYRDNRNLRWA